MTTRRAWELSRSRNTTVPPNHPEFVPSIPFSPRQDEDIEAAVYKFANDLKEEFKISLIDNIQLPLSHPPSETRRHIAALKIPTLSATPRREISRHTSGQAR